MRTRTRVSARKAGTGFERVMADWLAEVWDDRIDRRVKTGTKDKGDIANFRVGGHRVAIEVKAERAVDLAGWISEAEKEAANDSALCGIVFSKRRGKASPGEQYAIMTAETLLRLLNAAAREKDSPSI